MKLLLVGIILLVGCTAPPKPAEPRVTLTKRSPFRCPPLPYLSEDTTLQEERLFNATVRELYAKCAEGRR